MSAGQEWETSAGIWVAVHLRPETPMSSTAYPEDNRVVLNVEGTNSTRLSVFVNGADLDRLVDTVTAARDLLATGVAAMESVSTERADTAAADAA